MIGLCAAVERARWSVWDDEAVLLPRSYATRSSARAGCAVLLPARTTVEDAGEWLDAARRADPGRRRRLRRRARSRRVRDRARARGAGRRPAAARRLPRDAADEPRPRRDADRAPARTSLGHEDHRLVPGAFGDHDVRLRRRLAGRPRGGRARRTRPSRTIIRGWIEIGDGLRGDGLGVGRRAAGGAGGPDAPLRAGRAVASGGRPGGASRSRRWSRRRAHERARGQGLRDHRRGRRDRRRERARCSAPRARPSSASTCATTSRASTSRWPPTSPPRRP